MIRHILTLLAKTLAIATGIGAAVSLAGRFFGKLRELQPVRPDLQRIIGAVATRKAEAG